MKMDYISFSRRFEVFIFVVCYRCRRQRCSRRVNVVNEKFQEDVRATMCGAHGRNSNAAYIPITHVYNTDKVFAHQTQSSCRNEEEKKRNANIMQSQNR